MVNSNVISVISGHSFLERSYSQVQFQYIIGQANLNMFTKIEIDSFQSFPWEVKMKKIALDLLYFRW